jgi:hypothetical protein
MEAGLGLVRLRIASWQNLNDGAGNVGIAGHAQTKNKADTAWFVALRVGNGKCQSLPSQARQ